MSGEREPRGSGGTCGPPGRRPHRAAVEDRRPQAPQVGAGADEQEDDGQEAVEVEEGAHGGRAERRRRRGGATCDAVRAVTRRGCRTVECDEVVGEW